MSGFVSFTEAERIFAVCLLKVRSLAVRDGFPQMMLQQIAAFFVRKLGEFVAEVAVDVNFGRVGFAALLQRHICCISRKILVPSVAIFIRCFEQAAGIGLLLNLHRLDLWVYFH